MSNNLEAEPQESGAVNVRFINPAAFIKISSALGFIFSAAFLLVTYVFFPCDPKIAVFPVVATLGYALSAFLAIRPIRCLDASRVLLLTMFGIFFAGGIIPSLRFFPLLLFPIIPSFTMLLLGYRRGAVWLAIFLALCLLLLGMHASGLFFERMPPLHSAFIGMIVCTGLANLGVFSIIYQKFLEKSEALINEQINEITILSRTDPLTRTLNRRAFMELLEKERIRAERTLWRLSKPPEEKAKDTNLGSTAIIMLDVDFFKQVNDEHGHLAGDAVLSAIGQALTDHHLLRDADYAARYGGEEFVILQPETDGPGALLSAERLRAHVEALSFTDGAGRHFKVTISCGVAVFPHEDIAIEKIIAMADEAMYQAKRSGRNRCVLYKP
jgi:diguanylate cyclase (GGDEF)-like protein